MQCEASSTPVTTSRSPTSWRSASPGPPRSRWRIGAAGVCHSDLSVINGTIPWKAPSVLGHEGAGVVEAVGSEVTLGQARRPRGDRHPGQLRAPAGPAAPAIRPGASRRSGNVSQPFTFKGEPASNFAATSVFAESTIVKEVQAVKISQGRPTDLGLPHRVRRADRCRLGPQPGQGAARGDRGGLRRRRASGST